MVKRFKITAGVLTTLAALSPIALTISCGADDSYKYKDHSFADVDWSKYSYKDATIVSWIDGDTPIVNLSGGTSTIADKKDEHIRIAGIDTPELHVAGDDGKINVLTKGKEFEWADKGRIFGDSEMPVGSKIRIYTNGGTSYDRLVGSIFYGSHFEKMYSVEILKKGLAYPFISNAMASYDEESLEHITYRSIADAYNYAKKGKIGMWDPSAGDVSVIHGSTNVVPVTDYGSDAENKRKQTVYYYTKDL